MFYALLSKIVLIFQILLGESRAVTEENLDFL